MNSQVYEAVLHLEKYLMIGNFCFTVMPESELPSIRHSPQQRRHCIWRHTLTDIPLSITHANSRFPIFTTYLLRSSFIYNAWKNSGLRLVLRNSPKCLSVHHTHLPSLFRSRRRKFVSDAPTGILSPTIGSYYQMNHLLSNATWNNDYILTSMVFFFS